MARQLTEHHAPAVVIQRSDEVITVSEMGRRMQITKDRAYEMVSQKGFPLLDFGGERGKRVIWGDVLDWLRANKSVS